MPEPFDMLFHTSMCAFIFGKLSYENFPFLFACHVLTFLSPCQITSSGFFGEVFRGIWNGTDVAIKVFLEQDLTTENMEDFCNEIYILRYLYYACFCIIGSLLFNHNMHTNFENFTISFQPAAASKW